MQIPKIPKKQVLVQRKCVYETCNVEFEGSRTSKYCEKHRDPKNRKKEKKLVEDVGHKNRIVQHNYKNVETVSLKCELEGCGVNFEVKIYPRQFVYPKYCPEHRNDHKRHTHLETLKVRDNK